MNRSVVAGFALGALGLSLLTSGTHAQVPPPPAPPGGVGSYYLALGDSLGYGVTAPGVTPDPACAAKKAPGYVCILYGYLRVTNPQLQLENLSQPDVDSCVMVHGFGPGSPCVNPPGPGALASPLDAAVQFIHGHPGQVGPVTINVGGADLIPLLPAALTDPAGTAAKLPALIRAYQSNLDTALSALRAALGPTGQLVVVTQYNPLGGIGSPPLPAGLPAIAAGSIASLDRIMAVEAAKYNARVADVAAAFDASPGGAALLTFVPTSLASGDPSKINIYPTLDGYRLFGFTVARTVGVLDPATVTLKLAVRSVKHGKSLKATGTAMGSATLTIAITAPHTATAKHQVAANDDGTFSLTISAGKRTGKGSVRVCALDSVANKSACSAKLSFSVT